MKKAALYLCIIFLGLALLMSGAQSITGYYADPSEYGYHHAEAAYLNVSAALSIFGGLFIVAMFKRLEKSLF